MLRRFAPQFLYLASLALIGFSLFGSHGLLQQRQLNREEKSLARKAAELEAEVAKVKTELEMIEKDPTTLERRVRGELGLSKADEILYMEK